MDQLLSPSEEKFNILPFVTGWKSPLPSPGSSHAAVSCQEPTNVGTSLSSSLQEINKLEKNPPRKPGGLDNNLSRFKQQLILSQS